MANVEINDLTAKTTAAETDEVEIQETAGGSSKKMTRANFIPDSSETVKGKVELATDAEALTGTDTARATTPANVKAVADTKAATSHAHAASDVTSGLLANGRIATGTPTGSKFLRDDQSWQAIPGGGDALTTNPLSQFAATTSLQLKGVLSDETGSGAAVFAESPALVTPTGIVKGDVGLGNVDNTSDATKNAASVTLTNKTLTSPVINTGVTGTAIVDEDDMVSDSATKVPTQQSVKAYVDANSSSGVVEAVVAGTNIDVDATDPANPVVSVESLTPADIGLAASVAELDHMDGVTAPVQTQLDAKQASDAELSAIAGLTSAADKGIQFTGAGTASTYDLTAAGKALLDDADAAAQRTTLGLAIGTNVQAWDADLDALAGLSGVRGDIIYYGASGWTRLAKGTSGHYLTIGANDPAWAAVAAGGQTVYDAIVGSGETYTTVGAALTAGKLNIFVKDATTTTEAAILDVASNVRITGANRFSSIIDLQSYRFRLNGVSNVVFHNIGIKHGDDNNGAFQIYGSSSQVVIENSYLWNANTSSRGPHIHLQDADNIVVANNIWNCTGTTSGSPYTIVVGGTNSTNDVLIANNKVYGCITTKVYHVYNGNRVKIIGNQAHTTKATGVTFADIEGGSDVELLDNTWYVPTTSSGTWYGAIISGVVASVDMQNNRFVFPGASYGIGIYAAAGSKHNISGNRIINGIEGIKVNTGVTNARLRDNDVETAATPIIDTGTNTEMVNNSGATPPQERHFKRVKNTSGGQLVNGDVVILKAVAAGNEFTTTTTAGDNKVYGMVAETIADNASGLVQTLGKTTALKVNGTENIAIGDYLAASGTAGIAYKGTIGSITVTGDMAFAIALEAYTTDDSSGVIDALLITPRGL